jgi:TetR/AcrR family transcriptional regulator, cholesterol catabolism regulator
MTKDQILEAAALIFRMKGFHAASMQDIATAVNLQKASLYHHVSSKQEILLNLLDRALDVLTERMIEVLAQPLSVDQKLHLAVRTYLSTTTTEYRDLASVLLLEHRSLDPIHLALHIPRRDRYERLWRDMIQEGVDAGIFSCEDPAMTTRAIMGTLNWTITWFRSDGSLSADEIAGIFSHLFLDGLSPRGPSNGR